MKWDLFSSKIKKKLSEFNYTQVRCKMEALSLANCYPVNKTNTKALSIIQFRQIVK